MCEKAKLFRIVCDMEDDVASVLDYSSALAMIAETVDDEVSIVVLRLAVTIKHHGRKIEERRECLFHRLRAIEGGSHAA